MFLPSDVDWDALNEIVDAHGHASAIPAWLTQEAAVSMYRDMVSMRVFDRRSTAAQRQGRLGTFAIAEGHEAIQIGTAAALADHDC